MSIIYISSYKDTKTQMLAFIYVLENHVNKSILKSNNIYTLINRPKRFYIGCISYGPDKLKYENLQIAITKK